MKRFIMFALLGLSVTLAGCSLNFSGDSGQNSGVDLFGQIMEGSEQPKEDNINQTSEIPSSQSIDYEEVYSEVLDIFYYMLDTKDTEPFYDMKGATGIYELAMYEENPLDSVGYTFMDLTNDGIDELVVCHKYLDHNARILAVFTCDGDSSSVSNILEGYDRDEYYLLEDGGFYNFGSGGYASSLASISYFKDNVITIKEMYFTDFDEVGDIAIYYNTNGYWDVASSEKVSSDETTFGDIMDDYYGRTVDIDYLPFKEYADKAGEPNMNSKLSGPAFISIYDGSNLSEYVNYVSFVADESEYQTKVIIATDKDITDVKVYSLEFDHYDEEIYAMYCKTTEIYSVDMITRECPLVIDMTFMGDFPTYGFSYVDNDGTHYCTIEQSGYDGSAYRGVFFPVN